MEQLLKIYRYHNWRQKVQLRDGAFNMGTRGWDELPQLRFPDSFEGMSFLDVGANDGLFSFLAEQRGAKYVTATDIYRETSLDWHMTDGWSIEGITLLKEYFNSSIDIRRCSIYDLVDLQSVYDYVFCSNVLAWLEDPLKGLESLSKVNSNILHLREDVVLDGRKMESTPALYYVKQSAYGCYYNPNKAFITKALNDLGYRDIDIYAIDEFELMTKQYESLPDYYFEKPTDIFPDPFSLETSGKTSESTLVRQTPSIVNNRIYFPGRGWVDAEEGVLKPKIKIWSRAYHRFKYKLAMQKTAKNKVASKVHNCCIIARK